MLVYQNPNHAQDARFTVDGKDIVGFSARIDGLNPPTYTSWLIGTEAEYQEHHAEIHQARLAFIQEQGRAERRLVQQAIDNKVVPETEPETAE